MDEWFEHNPFIGFVPWIIYWVVAEGPSTWMFGALSAGTGIRAAGWIITALVTVAGLILTRIARAEGRPQSVSFSARRDCAGACSHPAG